MSLKGKTALVTGSTSGIGQGIAAKLAAQGCNLVIHGFGDEDEITKQREALENKHNIKTIFSGADVSKPDAIQELMEQAETFGPLDILVNNAGIQHVDTIQDFPPEKWDAIIAINLSSAFLTIRHVVSGMQQRNWGRIINIASAHGLVASPGKAAYVAAKHGIVGLTKVVALESTEHDITCNSICPGWVLTPLVQKQVDAIAEREQISNDEAKKQLLSEKQPKLEFTHPEDIGDMVVYLCSDGAKNITGTEFSIDGGWTAR